RHLLLPAFILSQNLERTLETPIVQVRFVHDSPLEGNGFELPVPGREAVNRDGRRTGCPEIGTDLLRNRRFESISLQAFVGRTGDLLETAMPLARLGDAINITD